MIVLGIETATPQVAVGLGAQEGVVATFQLARGRRHAETLHPAIEFVCRQAGIGLSEVSVVAVDVGPGLFTGLRVGVAAAKALAHALSVPMVGLSSLDLLAFSARYAGSPVAAVVDARKGEVFAARYRPVPGGVQRESEPRVASPEDLAAELVACGERCLLVGDGALRYAELFRSRAGVQVAGPGFAYPSAGALVELAHAKALREEFVQPSEIAVVYLRRPDAELAWERRFPGASGGLAGEA